MRRHSLLAAVALLAMIAVPAAGAAAPAAPAVPSATIGTIDCVNGGAPANLTNSGGQAATFTIQRDGTTIDSIEVAAGADATRLVPIAEGRNAMVTVQMQGAGYVSASVQRDCITKTAPSPIANRVVEASPSPAPVGELPSERGPVLVVVTVVLALLLVAAGLLYGPTRRRLRTLRAGAPAARRRV